MGSKLGRRVIHFANLPIKLLMPSSFSNITEIALKTIPSASKIEIKNVLESLYGFEVEKVRTLNMDGKKKKRGGLLIAKPSYKKAYVALKNPLSISPDSFPINAIEEDRRNIAKASKKSSTVEDAEPRTPHWLDDKRVEPTRGYYRPRPETFRPSTRDGRTGRDGGGSDKSTAKFPWSSMKSFGVRRRWYNPVWYPEQITSTPYDPLILRKAFEKNAARLTVPRGPSVACSTAKAVEWDAAWSNNLDPSGRASLGVHVAAYDDDKSEVKTAVVPQTLDVDKAAVAV